MKNTIKPINYAEEYHEDKPSIFRESENLDRLLQAIFDVCYQQQLDFLWLSKNLLNVDVAEKSHLDFIGNIVGQPRFLSDFNTEPYFGFDGSYQSKPFSSVTNPDIGGFWNSRSHFNTATARQLNDDEYRRLIKARAIYNQSNCTTNDLLEVINLLSNSKNNTVQMINHGLIQINTDDSSGIISYFVDRLLNDDNILPIAAGVRVGLEQSASDGSGGGILDTDWVVRKVYEGSTGSKVGIDAVRTKNNLEVKSSIEVTPTVSQVSERIKSGEYGAEVNKAVLDIDAEATDWVLDSANNRIKYFDTSGVGGGSWGDMSCSRSTITGSSPEQVAANDMANGNASASPRSPFSYSNLSYTTAFPSFEFTYIVNDEGWASSGFPPASWQVTGTCSYDGTDDPVEKYIPIPTVAAKIIANAEAGHTGSKNLLVSVVSVLASMKFYNPLF